MALHLFSTFVQINPGLLIMYEANVCVVHILCDTKTQSRWSNDENAAISAPRLNSVIHLLCCIN